MTNQTQIQANIDQLSALESGCGMLQWANASIIEHTGPDALDLLHRLTTKELLSVTEGRAQRTVLTSNRGRVMDVFLVVHIAEDRLLLVSDSDNSERTISAIDFYTIIEDAVLSDLSDSHVRISLVGPRATDTVLSALGLSVEAGSCHETGFDGAKVIVASDASRGVEWLDLICPAEIAGELATALKSGGSVQVDIEQFELFRMDHGIPGSDREYGEHANPIESGLLDLIDFDKGCYVGQEVIARLDAYDKVQRNLKVLESSEPLEVGAKLQSDSKPAGVVTSASRIETVSGKYLAMGLVRKAFVMERTVLTAGDAKAAVR